MDLLLSTVLFMILSLSFCQKPRTYTSIITVTNGAPWGDWGKIELCPSGHADSFSVKVLRYQGPLAWDDDTGLEGIRLYCTDGNVVQSSSAEWGTWSGVEKCPKGKLTSFSLRVQEFSGAIDDTGADNIKFKCSDGVVLVGKGHDWGTFGEWSTSCFGGFICGLQTRVQPPQGPGDDTGLTDVKFYCCE